VEERERERGGGGVGGENKRDIGPVSEREREQASERKEE